MSRKVIFNSKNVNITFLNRFSNLFQSSSARELQNELNTIIQTQILPTIDKGLSPVKGQRAFKKYKDPKKYPGDLKPSNKPNLNLTGKMLSDYKAYAQTRNNKLEASMGVHTNATFRSQKLAKFRSQMLAKVHNTGSNKYVPERPFIPRQSKAEDFNAKITASIRRAFATIIKRALKQGRSQK